MRKAYLSISYANRKNLQAEIDTVRQVFAQYEIELFVFVDTWKFNANESRKMMQQAFADIDACELLVAEVSEKAIGVGIEIGYAVARVKPVMYLRNSSAEHSTTAAGSTDSIIIYDDVPDLSAKLTEGLRKTLNIEN
jgi:nucleoside 2-deoxyribosyltransferase